ncbi:UDP-N-acetylmuramate--L-alanine ligase [Spongiivirga citrea]|uniref:UDP-N-acetylmuramate--L-alanine ligase n=1 Tax=Spongiivirga citrea TaxID=1481457 RepID=A0A6M0CK33_9FLAO|nr:UDP-N-acetylmuramate--L-alanine ligase [Spongiivirga citrea]NER18295.1 UDP-N-acetylmuramate--L-alanine ligase [Spongiivirga citrea]
MEINKVHNVYFIGIGGIGMSALARYFKMLGKEVAGYDKTPSKITSELEDLDVAIHFEDDVNLISDSFLDKENTLVVYTPAVPASHSELCYFIENAFGVYKRSEVLGFITKDTFCMAIAGTHGKTTTSTILGHLLAETDLKMTAFLGGIAENYNSNLILKGNDISVVEADEFDRSFLRLFPDSACITSMDADHLDIYGNAESLQDSFKEFANKIVNGGVLFLRYGLDFPIGNPGHIQILTYGLEDKSDYQALNIRVDNGSYVFDIKTPEETFSNFKLSLPGRHNLLNALAAFSMSYHYGVDVEILKKGLKNFKGIYRRFSYQVNRKERVFIDDYAHHPTEINAAHQAVREMYPDEKVLAIFQPHLFSRTKDFADDFAVSLSKFDELLLLDIYPAREEPIPGITSSWLLSKIKNQRKQLIPKSWLINEVMSSDARIVMTLGAGDIGVEVPKIKEAILNEV